MFFLKKMSWKQKGKGIFFSYILLALFCFVNFFCSKENVVFISEAQSLTFAGDNKEEYVLYEGISLNPGVYRAKLDIVTSADMRAYIQPDADTVLPQGLQCIGSPVYIGKDQCEFTFYLYEKVDNLRIIAQSEASVSIHTETLSIENTGLLWTMVWFGLSCLFVLAIVLTCAKKKEPSPEKRRTLIALGIISLIAVLPLLHGGSLITADSGYHQMRIEALLAGWEAGYFPVRIQPYWQQNYGYADGIFYCNLFLTIPALLRLIGFGVGFAWTIYCAIIRIAVVWVTYYCMKGVFAEERIAVALSALYSLSAIQFFKTIQTGAIGEGTAYIFLPLVLYGFWKIYYTDPDDEAYQFSFVPLGIGVSGMIQCHVLSSEITAFVALILVLIHIKKCKKGKVLLALTKAAGMTIVLCLWFIVPFLDYYLNEAVHIKYVFERTIQLYGVQIPQLFFHFWNGGENNLDVGMYQGYPVGLGLLLGVGLGWFLVLRLTGRMRKKNGKLVTFGTVCLAMSMLCCILSLKLFPWDKIQSHSGPFRGMISSLQYPHRFLGWATLFATFVVGCLMKYYGRMERSWQSYFLRILIVFQIVSSSLFGVDSYTETMDITHLSNPEGIGTGYISGGEYIIQGTDPDLLIYNQISASDGTEILEFTAGELRGKMRVTNQNNEAGYVEFPLLHYKGYRAWDEKGKELSCIKGTNHVVRVEIPGGYCGIVRVGFQEPVYWRISELISLGGYIALLILTVRRRKKENNHSLQADVLVNTDYKSFSVKSRSLLLLIAGVIMAALPTLATYDLTGMFYPDFLLKHSELYQGVMSRCIIWGIFLGEAFLGYYLLRMLLGQNKDASYGALLGSLAWFLSPYHLYLVYCSNEQAQFTPSISNMLKLYVWRGITETEGFQQYPLHVSGIWLISMTIYITMLLYRKQRYPKKRSSLDKWLAIITGIELLLIMGSCLIQACLLPASLLLAVQIAFMITWLLEWMPDRKTAVAIVAVLFMILVFTASFQLEDICFNGRPGIHGFV